MGEIKCLGEGCKQTLEEALTRAKEIKIIAHEEQKKFPQPTNIPFTQLNRE